MKRRTFLMTSLTTLGLPTMAGSEARVHGNRPRDASQLATPAITLADTTLDAEADDLPTMYNPQLVATIQAADSMVVKRETKDPKGDVVLSFSRHDDPQGRARRVGRVVLPFRSLRTGLYVRGPVRYRPRIDAAGVNFGVRITLVFDQSVQVIVYTDTAHRIPDLRGRPMWIDNTVIVARPVSTG
jgi:hypothetical protein